MKHVLFCMVLGMVLIVASCSPDQGQATGEDKEAVKEKVSPAVEAQKGEDDEAPKKFRVQLGAETYTIDLKEHPILHNFLSASSDPEEKLATMTFIPITMNEHADKALIEFACHETRCSYLLMDFSDEGSILLADLAKLEQVQVSHDSLIAIKFSRKNQQGVTTHHVEIADLEAISEKTFSIDSYTYSGISYEAYQFPIEKMKWTESGELTIHIPQVEDYASYNLENWRAKGSPTTELILTIN
ncbi:hypothetical protein [Thalassobacillus devorans]|uniref:hypothetical protein n=1 Tax=Thalassobacillus devorans TaxID=279813 RepID=UPI00049153B0|nr:hypothetical protein [Thalassobacillus devorans]